jgi:hypothetical protein
MQRNMSHAVATLHMLQRMHHVATCHNTLQRSATRCDAVRHVATQCDTLRRSAAHWSCAHVVGYIQRVPHTTHRVTYTMLLGIAGRVRCACLVKHEVERASAEREVRAAHLDVRTARTVRVPQEHSAVRLCVCVCVCVCVLERVCACARVSLCVRARSAAGRVQR